MDKGGKKRKGVPRPHAGHKTAAYDIAKLKPAKTLPLVPRGSLPERKPRWNWQTQVHLDNGQYSRGS